MINPIASSRVHAADIATLRQNRAKKTESRQETAETGKPEKPVHRTHPHGHIPPGLARAAEKIASKIFSRVDADANGTVTQQELGAIHSKHAKALASDLFQTATTETATGTTIETTEGTSETATVAPIETRTETPAQIGITEAQLKEALTKLFYAKVGATYTPPAPATTEQPDATAANTTTPSVVDSVSDESAADRTFTAVA